MFADYFFHPNHIIPRVKFIAAFVKCAGIIDIRGGEIFSINTNSGHYKPNEQSLPEAEKNTIFITEVCLCKKI